ncbi:MAG TPA: YicC/YloC family endoribonuclease [Chitinophagaceae bacterium]|nr:YicC/YloC family endoribonuclease [Chitinophagaceae bacterium]
MVYSMTGYGRSEKEVDGVQMIIEIKTLNGRNFDVINRFPSWLRPYELEIRNVLKQYLKRGSVDCSIVIVDQNNAQKIQLNSQAAQQYWDAYKKMANDLGAEDFKLTDKILLDIVSKQEVNQGEQVGIDEAVFLEINQLLQQTVEQVKEHRWKEGETIANDLRNNTHHILSCVEKVENYEEERITMVRERMDKNLKELKETHQVDENRLEQEIIHYVERLDISEEKQRLITHCQYFLTLLDEGNEEGIGKKLGFMSQEMGREINTLGSKANHFKMQKLVVQMKDSLEKIKEQILNVL